MELPDINRQNHLDLLVVWVLHCFLLGNPSALTDALQLVHIGRIDTDEPLWVRVQLVGVEGPKRGRSTILLLLLLLPWVGSGHSCNGCHFTKK